MEALGPILILMSIPLIFRWIPPNRVYGFRVPASLADRSVWYDANALIGRHWFVLGALMVALEFVLPAALRIRVLSVIGTVGFITILIADWRTANRWARERAQSASGSWEGDTR
jgi:uncharacterized membrane protein